jgi:hypothetical protein
MKEQELPNKYKAYHEAIAHFSKRMGPTALSRWNNLVRVEGDDFIIKALDHLNSMSKDELVSRMHFFNCLGCYSVENNGKKIQLIGQTVQTLYYACFTGHGLPKEAHTLEEFDELLKPMMQYRDKERAAIIEAFNKGPVRFGVPADEPAYSYAVKVPFVGPTSYMILARPRMGNGNNAA